MLFVFGDVEIDTAQVRLTKYGLPVECEPRVFELLVFFCLHPQEAISRAELVEHVWGGRIVSDAAVNRAVGELRKLVEDKPSSPQWIKTVSKVGYQLTVVPTIVDAQSSVSSTDEIAIELRDNNTGSKPEKSRPITAVDLLKEGGVTHSLFSWSTLQWLTLLLVAVATAYHLISPVKKHQGVLSRQPVTSLLGSAFNPYYQTKSSKLVFLHKSNKDSMPQLYMQEGGDLPQPISHDDFYYTDVLYGPDGYVYASRLDNLQHRNCDIVRIDLDNQQVTPLLSCGKRVVTELVFDEQRRRLIYRSRPSISAPYALYSFQLDTGGKQQLTLPTQTGNNLGDYIFSLSPDSGTLAVIEYRSDGVDQLKLIDLSNNQVVASSPFLDNTFGLHWRSNTLILAANSNGLYEFDLDSKALVALEASDQFGRLAQGFDINSVLTERSQLTVNIFSFSRDEELSSLTASSGVSWGAVLGHQSNIFAFISDRTGEERIYIKPENETDFSSEFVEPIENVAAMSWSPKDDKLVASINDALYLYSRAEGQWTQLAKEFTQIHHVAFAKEWVLFSAEVDGQWNIWQLSLFDGQTKQMTTQGGYSVQGDGDRVFFTKFNQAGLYQLDYTTGKESVLIEDFPIAGWRHWQLMGNKIYYLLGQEYNELELDSGNTHLIHRFKGRSPQTCNMSYSDDFFACEIVELSRSNIWQLNLSGS
jgi:transcriptional activator of cad operon